MGEEKKQKVYLETSFISYLMGRATTREPVASWQAVSRQCAPSSLRQNATWRDVRVRPSAPLTTQDTSIVFLQLCGLFQAGWLDPQLARKRVL